MVAHREPEYPSEGREEEERQGGQEGGAEAAQCCVVPDARCVHSQGLPGAERIHGLRVEDHKGSR